MSARAQVVRIDMPVRIVFKQLPYQRNGICASCRQPAFVCGLNGDSLVCIVCFEFEFGCQAPNYRRRRGRAT